MSNDVGPVGARIPGKEKLAFSVALFGQNLIYGISITFMVFAFTDFLGIAPAAVGVLLIVARTWDAVNDPLMGLVADRTRTRWGKFRPWLLWTPLPAGIVTIACFIDPGLSPSLTLAYAYFVYIAWGMIYTLTDVPFWALTTAMSRDSGERTRLITMARIFAMAGTVLPTAFVPALADMLSPKDLAVGYRGAVGIIVVVAVPLMTLAFFGTRERVPASPDRLTLKTTFRLLKTNRPLQILVIAGLLNSITLIAQSGTIYFVTHNLGNAALMTVAGGVGALAVTVGIGLTPLFTKSYGKVAVMIGSTILRSVFAFILFFVGYENLVVTGVFYFVIYALIGPTIVLQSAMIADSVDYAEWRTGERAEGVIFSFQTFLAKITAGIGGLLLGIILSGIGYQAGVDQTPFALRGLFATMVLSPAVGGILLIIPFFFYPMSDKRHAEIVREIKARSET